MSLCITHCDQREENCAGDVLTANDEKHMRSASFILHFRTFAPSSAACPLSRHLTLTFRFCSCSVTDCTQSMSVTFCVFTKNNQKKQKNTQNDGPCLTGSPLAALSPCVWATRFGSGGTVGHPPSLSHPAPPLSGPLEVMLITWIPSGWHGWGTRRWNPYFMHFAWGGN